MSTLNQLTHDRQVLINQLTALRAEILSKGRELGSLARQPRSEPGASISAVRALESELEKLQDRAEGLQGQIYELNDQIVTAHGIPLYF